MELVFQENPLNYAEKVFAETVTSEQTADLIVPDSMADCDRVIDSYGTVLLRSEECSAGSAGVTGSVAAGVLFVTEDGTVQRLETTIPFQVRREFPQPATACTMQCRCRLRSVDARPLNSRKLLVRVGLSCNITVFAQREHRCFTMDAPSENLQLKRTQIPLCVPLALGEKRFPVDEEPELPAGKSAIARLLKSLCTLHIGEQKLVGSKAVFKGAACLHVLYEDVDGGLCTHDWEIPFSQYVEMERESDDCELQTNLALTAMEVETDAQSESRRLYFGIEVRAQCTAIGKMRAELIEDAYCLDGELTANWDEWSVEGVLDRQPVRETAVAASEQGGTGVVDAWVFLDEAGRQRTAEGEELEVPLNCNLLCLDGDGRWQGRTLRTSVKVRTEVAENGSSTIAECRVGEVFANVGAAGTELRVPLAMTVETSATHRLRGVCGGTVAPHEGERKRQPAVILRRTDEEEELWEIAKSLRTPVQAIRAANDLDGTTVPADTLLLIPL